MPVTGVKTCALPIFSPVKTDSDEPHESDVSSDETPEMSEWEKRLEGK
jgi:hypothetical protein